MAGRPLFVYPNCINRQCRTADRRLHPPYISKGTILKKKLFDHTSIIKTVRDIHIPDSAPLTIRESVVGSLSDVRDLDAPRPDSDIPTFLQLMTTGAMRTNGLESFKKSGTDPEIDEFQESLLWLREEVEKEVTKERQLEVFGAASEADGTLYRLERAQAESRGTFREVGDRLVMLHMPNGDAIEQPSEHDIDTAVSAASGKQTWIENSIRRWCHYTRTADFSCSPKTTKSRLKEMTPMPSKPSTYYEMDDTINSPQCSGHHGRSGSSKRWVERGCPCSRWNRR